MDADAAHRVQIEKLEDQVRSATEFKVRTPYKRINCGHFRIIFSLALKVSLGAHSFI